MLCSALYQPGRDSVFFKPVRVTTTLPTATTMSWPMGDVLPDTPHPSRIDTVKLRQAVDAAFANPASFTAAFVIAHKRGSWPVESPAALAARIAPAIAP